MCDAAAKVLLTTEIDEESAPDGPGVIRAGTPVWAAPPPIWCLVEDRLLTRGWRLEHPAVRGVLISADGHRLDARDLVRDTYGEPDLAALRAYLASSEQ